MRKSNKSYKICSCIFFYLLLLMQGCSNENDTLSNQQPTELQILEKDTQIVETIPEEVQTETVKPILAEADWSDYFGGINGAAVIYDPAGNCYQIYNQELASARRSPCSAFKIISSLIALEHGIIDPKDSVRTWSKEIFWNEEWNKDIDFFDAFHASCVWYFREVIDEIGKDIMQEELTAIRL